MEAKAKSEILLQAERQLDLGIQRFLDAEGEGAPLLDLRYQVHRARRRRDEIVAYGKPVM
jgi:hypothetical protein